MLSNPVTNYGSIPYKGHVSLCYYRHIVNGRAVKRRAAAARTVDESELEVARIGARTHEECLGNPATVRRREARSSIDPWIG